MARGLASPFIPTSSLPLLGIKQLTVCFRRLQEPEQPRALVPLRYRPHLQQLLLQRQHGHQHAPGRPAPRGERRFRELRHQGHLLRR